MIQDVEDLCSELDIECFRDSMDREILGHREIQIHQFGPYHGITARIAQQIGAIHLPSWRWNFGVRERGTLRSERR